MFRTKALNSYSYVTQDRYGYPSLSCGTEGTYEKSFDKFEDAVKEAKKTAAKRKEDVEIWSKTHVVRFPEPDLEVTELAKETKSS